MAQGQRSLHDDNDIETICTVKLGGTRIVVTGMTVYACRTFLLSSAGPVAVPQQILNKRLRFNSTRRLISLQYDWMDGDMIGQNERRGGDAYPTCMGGFVFAKYFLAFGRELPTENDASPGVKPNC